MSRNKPYDLHPEARMEIEGGDRWYSERSPDAADEFVFSVYDGIEAVSRAPDRWPRHLHGTRRHLLKKFPYSIIYLDEPGIVKIVGCRAPQAQAGILVTATLTPRFTRWLCR